ncbi:hypothetical protein CEXT_38181, partial [Caerostris extrusa]
DDLKTAFADSDFTAVELIFCSYSQEFEYCIHSDLVRGFTSRGPKEALQITSAFSNGCPNAIELNTRNLMEMIVIHSLHNYLYFWLAKPFFFSCLSPHASELAAP